MTTSLLIVVVAIFIVVNVLLNIALLRLCCLAWRVKDATWLRAVNASLIMAFAQMLAYSLLLGLLGVSRAWDFLSGGELTPVALLTMIFASIVIPVWAIQSRFKMSPGKAAGVWATLAVVSTVVAYAQAFALRTTLAEAFVVPTGAMAPTVLGQHIRVRCPNCGGEANIGASHASLLMYGWNEIERHGYTCQQCGEPRVPLNDEVLTGDRILVDKTSRQPRRFDVAVFHVRSGQFGPQIPGPPNPQDQKYVKRCVGLPGEEIAIVDGDLFIDGLRVQKGPHEIEDLWIEVHDTDLRPAQPLDDGPAWRAVETYASGWKSQQGKWQILRDADLGAELEFVGPLTDHYAYELPLDAAPRRPIVPDWRITVDLAEFKGDGALGFFWQRGDRTTCLGVTPQLAVQVFRDRTHFAMQADDASSVDATKRKAAGKTVARIAFAVRDGNAYLSLDGEVLATVELAPSRVDEARTLVQFDDPPLRFGLVARRCDATLSRIQLHRDVYYRTLRQMEAPMFGDGDDTWQLDREYFFLGDQSPQSQDCRFIGPIHEREMIGLVRWCYWPPERMREFP